MRSERYDYAAYSRLAGPLTEPGPGYRVTYRSLLAREPHRIRAAVLMALAPTLSLVLLLWLVWPSHWTERSHAPPWLLVADAVMLGCIALIELFRLVNVVSVAHATMVARDPVPVRPETGTRVAFLTTYVPGKEPLAMLRATLTGAAELRHAGPLDVWLLDEGDDVEARELCAELGVHHFTRRGVPRWNQDSGPHRARTKHGNYNAWLDAHGDEYDFFASVDTDHVPLPGFLERMLGYFRDPDVAFVVGPQVYGNYEGPVTKAAESQQFLFHALIQRAGNRYRSPMFVGTNNAVRISALRTIGGLCDSVTEDMATGFELHRTVNPDTGNRWTSVYTPDVLAVGEGPSSWTDFFSQQLRWSRGTYETVLGQYGRGRRRHRPGSLLNYSLMLAFYPMAAITWTLGVLGCVLYLLLGASGTQVSSSVWLMLYSDVAALQIGLYVWNRRHNVSPHEPEGSSGTAGMLMSALSAPVYARSLLDAVLRRRSTFVVTPKGWSATLDRPATFRWHLGWAGLLTAALLVSVLLDHTHAAMRTWALIALVVALAPPAVWAWTTSEPHRRAAGRHRAARGRATARRAPRHALLAGIASQPADPDRPTEPGGEGPPRRPVGAEA
ncbi:glycosyltransferase family 2 protein [Streptomyces sp. DSM 44915]|uniref:Glycosyltransferase family 2 protein n=1 Tax=Streptomyces chisholmiae TaxID=3075540 RepID=A0ABU2JI71_9ACTN|nr:glycosyltransferase family 2 protein [Streptomyces sp. DSM 44915]MDT0264690.1 glycosyltransferase family 2 protein [Streptomyces sp. DSM 44915]